MEEEKKQMMEQQKQRQEMQSQFARKHKKFMEQLTALNQSNKKQQEKAEQQKQRREQSNHEFVAGLKDAVLTVPDEVVDYNLEKAGCDCPDIRVRRLVGIAAKKLIFDIVRHAKAHREHHINGLPVSKQKAFKNKV